MRHCKTISAPYMAARIAVATMATATATPIMAAEIEGRLHVNSVRVMPAGRDKCNRLAVRAAYAATGNLCLAGGQTQMYARTDVCGLQWLQAQPGSRAQLLCRLPSPGMQCQCTFWQDHG